MRKSVGSLLCVSMLLSTGIAAVQPAISMNNSNVVLAEVDNNIYDSGEFLFRVVDGGAKIIGVSSTNKNLKTVVIPRTIADKNQNNIIFPVKIIGSYALDNYNSEEKDIESLIFESPSNVESIEEDAFANNSLQGVDFPQSLKEVKRGAFENNRLSSINIPESVENIDMSAFFGNKIVRIDNFRDTLFEKSSYGIGDQRLDMIFNNSPESVDITLGTGLYLREGSIRVIDAKIDGRATSVINNKITMGKDDRKLIVSYQYFINGNMIAEYTQSFFFPHHGQYQVIQDMLNLAQQKLKNGNYDMDVSYKVRQYINSVKAYLQGGDLADIRYDAPFIPQLSSEQDLIDNFQRAINELVPINSGSNSGSGSGSNSNSGTSTPSVNPTVKDFEGILQVTAPNGTPIYKDADLSNKTDRILNKDSRWRVFGVKKVEGNTLAYNLGGNQWVKADDVLITAEQGSTQDKMTPMSGTFVVKVPNKPTWSTVVWREDLSTTTKYLKPRTSWKVFGKKLIKGKIYYNLGGNQWASSEYGFLK